MGINEQRIQLKRSSPQVAWGFRLQGGSDSSTPLSVQRVFSGSPSDGQLQRGDILVSVDGRSLRGMSPVDAQDLITSTGLVLNLGIQRGGNIADHSYDTHGAAPQSNYIPQHDNYSSGGARSFDPHSQGGFSSGADPRWSSQQQQQPSSHWNTDPIREHGAYQPPPQFNASKPIAAQNHYSPSAGSFHTNGGYQDHHSAGNQTYKSSATVFGGQSQGNIGHSSNDGGLYGAEGPSIVSQPRNDNDDEEYERKPISNIKQMFNKPDETGPSAVAHIKGRRPRAPMYKANEESSFVNPQYGPNSTPAPKSSLTPSRPGAVQRGAPDNRPSSYVPAPIKPPAAGSYAKKLYGYSQDTTPAPSRYVGGFVGVSELTKSTPMPVPVKKPPGQKKKDFDPSQSSVLRILQEEEERRKSGRGPVEEEFDQQPRPPPQQQQQRHHQQQHQRQQQQQRGVGQKWEQQQQQHHHQASSAKSGGGPSLQALLERDQAQNPQEDPANNRALYESQPQPSQGEYRRPGTTYKPAEHKVKANVDDYPIPEQYLSGGRGKQHGGDIYQPGGGAGYQSSYQPDGGYQTGDGGRSYQSSAKFSPGSGASSAGGFSPRAAGGGSNGYHYGGAAADYGRGPSGGGGGYYPSTNYGMDGIPASDF